MGLRTKNKIFPKAISSGSLKLTRIRFDKNGYGEGAFYQIEGFPQVYELYVTWDQEYAIHFTILRTIPWLGILSSDDRRPKPEIKNFKEVMAFLPQLFQDYFEVKRLPEVEAQLDNFPSYRAGYKDLKSFYGALETLGL